jgi:predicted glycosyltransferase involved in capsule biosynthesis
MSMKKGKIIIVDPEKFDYQFKALKKSGVNSLQVISDFDRTITKCFVEGQKAPSLVGVLREKNICLKKMKIIETI